jgi:hypothetical protein
MAKYKVWLTATDNLIATVEADSEAEAGEKAEAGDWLKCEDTNEGEATVDQVELLTEEEAKTA